MSTIKRGDRVRIKGTGLIGGVESTRQVVIGAHVGHVAEVCIGGRHPGTYPFGELEVISKP